MKEKARVVRSLSMLSIYREVKIVVRLNGCRKIICKFLTVKVSTVNLSVWIENLFRTPSHVCVCARVENAGWVGVGGDAWRQGQKHCPLRKSI